MLSGVNSRATASLLISAWEEHNIADDHLCLIDPVCMDDSMDQG